MNEVRYLYHGKPNPTEFGHRFVRSDAFMAMFDEGMGLVEETAAYLDGEGRRDAAALPPETGDLYVNESLRLTTRLMHIASWLLLERAWAEGDLNDDQLNHEKERLRLNVSPSPASIEDFDKLPRRLRELNGLALRLYARILHLELLLSDYVPRMPGNGNAVTAQLNRLEQAFRKEAAGRPKH
jgi:regulator of CtrA degradation